MSSSATAITNLLYTYAENIDAGRLEDAATLFRHATIRTRGGTVLDEAGLLNLWRTNVKIYDDGTPRTKHVITNPIIEIDDDAGRATCRSYYTVLQATSALPLQVIAAGRYHDEFERAGETWRFASRDYSLLDLVGDFSSHLLMDPSPAPEN
ncbi:nuclear transport factor 2 family protein [Rhodococcus sp. KBS0724]|jgi:3-phenylpropionate/cinnamic acid dioxygenase small subunit|uniref:nuclear transport factor 2 family protein n=1 Tax=Rhodococcus sp. KBS0724 TaxID=1179674 RepID=UPI00110E7ACB|nr:nuclear transport factor 2 family protein [Rhodococcus sp. KBS0724]TSD49530.1 nuclear transport factor 2 family protein [Rhodococcus sp. KBS0724]